MSNCPNRDAITARLIAAEADNTRTEPAMTKATRVWDGLGPGQPVPPLVIPGRIPLPIRFAPPIVERAVAYEARQERRDLRPVMAGDVCHHCGGQMVRTGTCLTCSQCGDTSGCG